MKVSLKNKAVAVAVILSLVGCMLSVTNVAVYANETAEYKVRYVEEGTDNDLIYPKVVTNKQVGEVVTEVAPNIDGATLVSKECKNLVAGEEDLIIFYYAPNSVTTRDLEYAEGEIQPYGDSIPLTKWNVSTKGVYELSCNWNRSFVYSNYKMTGAKSYKVRIRNKGTDKLRVRAKTRIKTYRDVEIDAGITMTFWVDMDSTSDSFYFRFDSEDDYCCFSGTVSKS